MAINKIDYFYSFLIGAGCFLTSSLISYFIPMSISIVCLITGIMTFIIFSILKNKGLWGNQMRIYRDIH